MSYGDPPDPSLPADRPAADPNFVPAPSFVETMSPEDKQRGARPTVAGGARQVPGAARPARAAMSYECPTDPSLPPAAAGRSTRRNAHAGEH